MSSLHIFALRHFKINAERSAGFIRSRIAATVLAVVGTATFMIVVTPSQAQAGECSTLGLYYGQGWSGTGNYGTADQIWTWTHWSVTSGNYHWSDESVWSIDYNNINNALEVGFFSGWGKGNINGKSGWTNGMTPYYTINDGNNEYDEWGTFLPASTYISMFAHATGPTSYAYVNGNLNVDTQYIVNQPRWNFTQGEVTDTGTWMGGGSGDSSTVYWIDSSGSWHHWGFLKNCANSPYWSSSSNGQYYFINGGY